MSRQGSPAFFTPLRCLSWAICWVALFAPASCWGADLTGEWAGTWESCRTGHHGVLKATFCRQDEQHYQVHFRGTFFKLVPFRYTAVLNVIEDGDEVRLSGESYLGRVMGTFTYTASATACEFTSQYDSCKDNGLFKLSRCPSCCP